MTVAHFENVGSLPERLRFAQALAASNLLPTTYRDRPANVLVAMELGNALGIAPIVAINEVNVIQGSPALSASLMVALCRQAGHKVRMTGDAKSASCTIIRSDDQDFEHTVIWDEAKARANGLWGKGHWAKSPDLMLKWRAASECVRMACSEVLAGIKYTPEEVEEFSAPTTHTVTATVPPVEPKPAHSPEPVAPVLADAVDAAVPAAAKSDSISPAQLKMMGALMSKLGMTDRAEALAWVHSITGRQIGSRNDLTKREATQVIDALRKAEDDSANPSTGEVVQAEIVSEDPWVVNGQ